jgi:hypothetical protein
MLNFLKNKWHSSGKYSPAAIKATNQSFSLSRILYGLRHIHAIFAGSVWFTRNQRGLRQILLGCAKSEKPHANVCWFMPNRHGLCQIILVLAKSISHRTNIRLFLPNTLGFRQIQSDFADRCDFLIKSSFLGLKSNFSTIRIFYRCSRQ